MNENQEKTDNVTMNTPPSTICRVKSVTYQRNKYKKKPKNQSERNETSRLRRALKTKASIIKNLRTALVRANTKVRKLETEWEEFSLVDKSIMKNVVKLWESEEDEDTYACIMMDQVDF